MGNCGQKIQSAFRKKQPANSKIGQPTPCPCCGTIFAASSTFLSFNNHIEACLLIHTVNQPEPQQENVARVDQIVLKLEPKPIQFETSKEDPNLEYFWSKVPVLLTPRDQEENSNLAGRKNSNTSVSSAGSSSKYRWERKAYNKNDLNADSLRKLNPSEIAKLSFEKKQIWLRQKCDSRRIPWTQGADWIKIHPDNILMNSLFEIAHCDMHKEVKIQIIGDKVNDAGGLLREWIHLCMKEIFHPNTGMFQLADTSEVTYKVNKEADQDEHVLNCFRLLGKIIGKAIFERITMNGCFDRSIINYILGKPTTLPDIYFYDTALYNSWTSMVQNKLTDDDFIDVFAVYKKLTDGAVEVIELIPNGEEVIVNDSNKLLYIEKKIKYLCVDSVKEFLDAMCSEIYKIIPKNELSVFEPHELEMILIGVPFISVEEWKTHTEYTGYTPNNPTVEHFWQIMSEFSQDELSKFLQYCTGSARTPVEGFKKLESNRGNYSKFNLRQIAFEKANPFPKAHTCFNRLELPDYKTLELTRMYMKAIVKSDLEGVYGLD